MEINEVVDNEIVYGSKGQSWSEEFIDYMNYIVNHPNYKDMPDAIKEDGKIQWEAPSNRSTGLYQYTYNKRKEWWLQKAISLNIDVNKDQWISRTAKILHPIKEKPCKKCGRIMKLQYVYPTVILIKRFQSIFGEELEISPITEIHEVIMSAYDLDQTKLFDSTKILFKASNITIPELDNDVHKIIEWIYSNYITHEPTTLSPGAMSNAPDRFDGFHSFNKCCRGTADKGRNKNNLRTYTTDRRVFEFWSEGNWIAADRMMGLVRTNFTHEQNADGGTGAPTADHIGPISLGFCHDPEFKLLSRAANSAKNNRMTLSDVQYLIGKEKEKHQVISSYAQELWNLRKNCVDTDEKALRLSKLLRDNQRNFMRILSELFLRKKYSFLIYLLGLKYADYKVEFIGLKVINFITCFDSVEYNHRDNQFSLIQKTRRVRIGFDALLKFIDKTNRHKFDIDIEYVNKEVEDLINFLDEDNGLNIFDEQIDALYTSQENFSDLELRKILENYPKEDIEHFILAKEKLNKIMDHIGSSLSNLWDSDRYVR